MNTLPESSDVLVESCVLVLCVHLILRWEGKSAVEGATSDLGLLKR